MGLERGGTRGDVMVWPDGDGALAGAWDGNGMI
jgi:hypothetical protein